MSDRADPSRSTLSGKLRAGIVGAAYLALAGIAMTGWIALLVWLARRVIAGL